MSTGEPLAGVQSPLNTQMESALESLRQGQEKFQLDYAKSIEQHKENLQNFLNPGGGNKKDLFMEDVRVKQILHILRDNPILIDRTLEFTAGILIKLKDAINVELSKVVMPIDLSAVTAAQNAAINAEAPSGNV